MNRKNLPPKKKLLFIIICFIIFIIITSIIYILVNLNLNKYTNNPGGTGGDYSPKNTVTLTNENVLLESVSSSSFNTIKSLLDESILYNISISNNHNASSEYIQTNVFNIDSTSLYKDSMSYEATIIDSKINSTNNIPWNYWFNLSVNDGRKFRIDIDVNPDNNNDLVSIKKII